MDTNKLIEDIIEKYGELGYVSKDEIIKYYDEDSDEFLTVKNELEDHNIFIKTKEEIEEIEELMMDDSDEDEPDPISLTNIKVDVEDFDKDIEELAKDIKVDDPVRMYLKEIGTIPLLEIDQETDLATKVTKGLKAKEKLKQFNDKKITLTDEEIKNYNNDLEVAKGAKQSLINANLRLVVSIAKRYVGRGMQFLDLIQEGNMGLMKAVDKFDVEKGFKFSTYATWWIRQAITRAVADQARTIRIPVHMVETINKLVRVQRQLVQELSREPTPEEVAERMGFSVEKVQSILKIAQEPISLESPVGEEDDSSLGDFISDKNALNPYEYSEKEMLRRELDEVLSTLTDREEKVLRMRFGLLDGRQRTLEEVGKEFGVTRERIRQIEAKALRKLKHPTRSKKLRDFQGKK